MYLFFNRWVGAALYLVAGQIIKESHIPMYLVFPKMMKCERNGENKFIVRIKTPQIHLLYALSISMSSLLTEITKLPDQMEHCLLSPEKFLY